MTKLTLLQKVEDYISNLFLEADTSGLFYHDFNHTLSIVKATTEIAQELNLSLYDKDILITAAWFHDVGYLYTRTEHEAKSIMVLKHALNRNYKHLLDDIIPCIAATKLGVIPQNNLAALLKDADIAFGSAYDFLKTNTAYREELRISEGKIFDDDTWRKMSLTFLENVKFYSDYGKQHFTTSVEQNLNTYRLK